MGWAFLSLNKLRGGGGGGVRWTGIFYFGPKHNQTFHKVHITTYLLNGIKKIA